MKKVFFIIFILYSLSASAQNACTENGYKPRKIWADYTSKSPVRSYQRSKRYVQKIEGGRYKRVYVRDAVYQVYSKKGSRNYILVGSNCVRAPIGQSHVVYLDGAKGKEKARELFVERKGKVLGLLETPEFLVAEDQYFAEERRKARVLKQREIEAARRKKELAKKQLKLKQAQEEKKKRIEQKQKEKAKEKLAQKKKVEPKTEVVEKTPVKKTLKVEIEPIEPITSGEQCRRFAQFLKKRGQKNQLQSLQKSFEKGKIGYYIASSCALSQKCGGSCGDSKYGEGEYNGCLQVTRSDLDFERKRKKQLREEKRKTKEWGVEVFSKKISASFLEMTEANSRGPLFELTEKWFPDVFDETKEVKLPKNSWLNEAQFKRLAKVQKDQKKFQQVIKKMAEEKYLAQKRTFEGEKPESVKSLTQLCLYGENKASVGYLVSPRVVQEFMKEMEALR